MVRAKQLPSGMWRCQPSFTDDYGIKHRASFTEKTARQAERKALLWQEGLIEAAQTKSLHTFEVAANEYIDTLRATGASPSTIRAYASYLRTAYSSLLGKPVNKITLRDVQLWVNERSAAHTPKTVKNNLGLISAVLKANECKLDLTTLKLPKAIRQEMEIPNDEQITAMLEETYGDDDMYISIALASIMGLRRSEICALKWSDMILFPDGTGALNVDKALVLDENLLYVEKDPKTQAGSRQLAIPSALLQELKRRRNLRPNMVSITPNQITERYSDLRKRFGAPSRFHNLRHYHASVMLREGVPEKYITADMGHSSFDMVKRVYGHVMSEKRSAINSAMDAHASAVMGNAHEMHTNAQKS